MYKNLNEEVLHRVSKRKTPMKTAVKADTVMFGHYCDIGPGSLKELQTDIALDNINTKVYKQDRRMETYLRNGKRNK